MEGKYPACGVTGVGGARSHDELENAPKWNLSERVRAVDEALHGARHNQQLFIYDAGIPPSELH